VEETGDGTDAGARCSGHWRGVSLVLLGVESDRRGLL
jgi:hypothetical protein